MRRLVLALLCIVALATGCAEAQEAADNVRRANDAAGRAADCARLASDVSGIGLNSKPNRASVEEAAKNLETRVRDIGSPDLKDAAGTLATRAKEYADALRRADAQDIQRARARVDKAATVVAENCGIPMNTGGEG